MATNDKKTNDSINKNNRRDAWDSVRSDSDSYPSRPRADKPIVSQQQPTTPRPDPTKKGGR